MYQQVDTFYSYITIPTIYRLFLK